MQVAIGCYCVALVQAVKVIYFIPKDKKIMQVTPENYRKYAKKEIELATISGIVGFFSLFIALWTHLHLLTPILVCLYTIGLVNIVKWF